MSKVIEITTDQEEQAFINNNEHGVIFFGSNRCPLCRNMVPVVNNLANKYQSVAFAHVEVTEVAVTDINVIPVFVGYRNQVPVDVVLGASVSRLTKMIETKLI